MESKIKAAENRVSGKFKILLISSAIVLIGLAGNDAADAWQEFCPYQSICPCTPVMSSPHSLGVPDFCVGESFRMNNIDVIRKQMLLALRGYGVELEHPCILQTQHTLYGKRNSTESIIVERVEQGLAQINNRIDHLLEKIAALTSESNSGD